MDTFLDLITAVESDLTIGDEVSFISRDTTKLAINRARIKCESAYKWPELQDAKQTTTQTGLEYYTYPQEFKTNSIFRLEVDSVQWGEDPDGSPMRYEDYLQWRGDTYNANSTDKNWSNQQRRYFIYPVPTTSTAVISIWGQKVGDELVNDADTTVFSYSAPEVNEAIVLEAKAILRGKAEQEQQGQFYSIEAKALLGIAWNKIKQESGKYEKTQPFFEVGDMFRSNGTGGSNNNIGRFNS